MDSRRDFTSKKVFPGYFPELSEKANPSLSGLYRPLLPPKFETAMATEVAVMVV